jgi:hypothetical protein
MVIEYSAYYFKVGASLTLKVEAALAPRKCGQAPAGAMGSIFSCPLFLCERFFLGKQKEMRINPDECNYLMNHHYKDSLQVKACFKAQ